MPHGLTPTQIYGLIGLWRRQTQANGKPAHVSDIAGEVDCTIDEVFKTVRAENSMRQLEDLKMVKEVGFKTFRLTKTGSNLCRALHMLGLPPTKAEITLLVTENTLSAREASAP